MRRGLHHVAGALLVLLLRPPPVTCDRTTATALADQARKAAEEGDLRQAEQFWLRAALEDETYVPARLGLAESLLARGQAKQGLADLRAALEAASKQPEATGTWAPDVARAKKRLTELEVAVAAVKSRVSKHIDASLALAVKWSGKDPDLARGILSRVLRLEPANTEALKLTQTLGEGAGRVVSLFNGRDGAGWIGFSAPFKVVEGALEGDVGPDGKVTITEEKHTGDYDFRAEMRLMKQYSEPMAFALVLFRSGSDYTSFGYGERMLWGNDEVGGTRTTGFKIQADTWEPKLDLATWNRFDVRLRGGTITAWLNGRQVGEFARREASKPVQLGLTLQQGRVQFRAIEVRRL